MCHGSLWPQNNLNFLIYNNNVGRCKRLRRIIFPHNLEKGKAVSTDFPSNFCHKSLFFFFFLFLVFCVVNLDWSSTTKSFHRREIFGLLAEIYNAPLLKQVIIDVFLIFLSFIIFFVLWIFCEVCVVEVCYRALKKETLNTS